LSISFPGELGYGASEHYLGARGEEYFSWQSAGGSFRARIDSHDYRHLVRPGDTVLDFGCGGGFLLASLDCARRLGVEINPIARAHANELGIECHESIEEIPEAIADVIISNHALEHVPYPIAALKDLRRRLKVGGTLGMVLPIDNWQIQKRYDPADINHHLHTWTAQLIGNTLVEAGFEQFGIKFRVNARPGSWTMATYGRLPFWLFKAICYGYGLLTGKGRELVVTGKRIHG